MSTEILDETIRTLNYSRDQRIESSIENVFEAILDEMGPHNELPGKPMPMVVERWPGGRWFRDLGNNAGHYWGTVQVIKPPTLLEIIGPMFMSYPAAGHLTYKLQAEGKSTVLSLRHRAFGMIPEKDITGVQGGWGKHIDCIIKAALKRVK